MEASVAARIPFGTEYHVRAKSRTASITFISSSACSIFVNRCHESNDEHVLIDNFVEIAAGIQHKARVTHDEPFVTRRRNWIASRCWSAIHGLYAASNRGAKLVLKSDRKTGKLSAETADLRLRVIVVVGHTDEHGFCESSAAAALLAVSGSNADAFQAIEDKIALSLGPR